MRTVLRHGERRKQAMCRSPGPPDRTGRARVEHGASPARAGTRLAPAQGAFEPKFVPSHGSRHMPRGSKSAYTTKQKRQARHIEESYESRGVSSKTAARRAWATVNKQDGGALKKSGSRRKSKRSRR